MTNDCDRTVLIKNIPYEIDENTLSDWCSSFGPVANCSLKRDKYGNSRGFAFVTYVSIDGHNNILAKTPHRCLDRYLFVKTANDRHHSSDQITSSSLVTDDNINSTTTTTTDTSSTFDTENYNRLAVLRDELDANLECMQIAHEHEVKLLNDKLLREKKLLQESEQLYKEAEEDYLKIKDENIRIRTCLIKNVMQTFNIRRDLARQTKDQLKKCAQIQMQYDQIK
ncbi:unnamed protein product [Adineta steineri]|uniref:RRM domain-containing protein n=1 Tax=Adineta steineri TaxID=433720 RepID=A0A814CTG5_9BILA|nr:unnamed protein product [Adineta steineri]CAF3622422.1 unnamed protein product [Adineta steineri]